ncbi:hypothetical protein GCM10018779_62570 [Streptomyces griseocarneus]|nr:hypothetical protein GCM10018779_62570 [Streptomyces griseocarneus]
MSSERITGPPLAEVSSESGTQQCRDKQYKRISTKYRRINILIVRARSKKGCEKQNSHIP